VAGGVVGISKSEIESESRLPPGAPENVDELRLDELLSDALPTDALPTDTV
jgi:hypothetical protein